MTTSSEPETYPTYTDLQDEAKRKAGSDLEKLIEESASAGASKRMMKNKSEWVKARTEQYIKHGIRGALQTLGVNSSKLKPKVSKDIAEGWANYLETAWLYSAHTDFEGPLCRQKHPVINTFEKWGQLSDVSVSSAARLIHDWQFPIDKGRVDRILQSIQPRAETQSASPAITVSEPYTDDAAASSSSRNLRGRKPGPRSLPEDSTMPGPSTEVRVFDYASQKHLLTMDDHSRLSVQLDGFIKMAKNENARSRAQGILDELSSGEITAQEGMTRLNELIPLWQKTE